MDSLAVHDSCGLSSNQLKNYYYYNIYEKKDFKYTTHYQESAILKLVKPEVGEDKDIMPLILKIIPFLIIIGLGILFLIPCGVLWICICTPKCCCRKKSRITKPFNCLIVLFSLTGVSITLFSIVIAFLKSSEKGINGTLCTLTMLTEDIVKGVGLLKKTEFTKPYWYGLTEIDNLVTSTNTMLTSLTSSCSTFLENMQGPFGTGTTGPNYTQILTNFPNEIIQVYTDVMASSTTSTITIPNNPTEDLLYASNPITITPLYISSLGPPSDNKTDLGKILTDFQNNYASVIQNIILNMTIQCRAISNPTVSSSFTGSVNQISDITGDLGPAMESLSGDLIDTIDKYKGLLINYIFKSFLAFNIITMIFILYEAGFMLFFSYRNYNIMRTNLICVWVFIGFFLIILFIFTAIFGIIGTLISDMGDIIDFLFSNENISSDNPRIIGGSNLGNINTCLRGDGDLLSVFLDSSTREFTKAIDILFNMYYPIMQTYDLVNSDTSNSLNTIESITTLEEYYKNVAEDFTLATSSTVHGNLDISKQITELNKYTVSSGGYLKECSTNDYYVSTQSKCPSEGTNICRVIPIFVSYPGCTISTIGLPYTNLQNAVDNFEKCFIQFIGSDSGTLSGNKGIIKTLQDEITSDSGLTSLKKRYEGHITSLKSTLEDLKTVISDVYNSYADYVNVEELENGTYVSVFSWLNCTIFGKDINATLNTMKVHLRRDLRIIFFISLSNNCVIIAIMVVVTFLLNWYKFDPLENNPVGEMEIGEKKNKYNSDEIYSDGLSNSINSKKSGNSSDRTNRILYNKKSKMKDLVDEQTLQSQFGDNIKNKNKFKTKGDYMMEPNIISQRKKNNFNNSSDSGDTFQLNLKKNLTMNKKQYDEDDNPVSKINKKKNI